ncbi:PQQ-binding-like beta-propeller repeat protein [Spirosoma foliorum]|uniref:PQQ-binding-like beta-propeller repeat protein n=1 Tax=Spirosoma foliorum TaxID=2710596 RepID=A0A7G5GS92_9BACT|nr:PQQ-binding-like beta-propeller repeat protein [Spirosoma foliorum]QMW01734.1 PQQ-binding-like beta-propeller repeat protein [Spirosoma foliorum]
MKHTFPLLSTLFTLLLLWATSCKKTEDTPSPGGSTTNPGTKSSAKSITAFAFNGLNPTVTATIDATAKTISATVTAGMDVTKLVPTITVSDKATVSPASGVAQDFSKVVTYTITAEDGSTQAYLTTVTVEKPVNNGTVYVGNLDGVLVAVDALTGDKKWSFTAGGAIESTPTVANGLVYVASWDKKLYALDAATGAKKWEFETNKIHPFAAPMVANGIVYYGGDPYLYALDALTGAKKWQYQGDAVRTFDASPTMVDGIVYASLRTFSPPVFGLDALTGSLKWRSVETDGSGILSSLSESSPAVANGFLYIGSEGDGVSAFDLKTGALKWRFTGASIANSSPTVTNGVLYIGSGVFGTNNKKLYALNATTGVKKWEYAIDESTAGYSSPIVANGIVYIGSGSTLYAVDVASGAKKWDVKPEANTLIYSGPVVAGGYVYQGIGKKLYAFDAATGAKKWEYDTGRTIDQSSPCVLAKDGTVYHAGISGMVQ